VVSFTRTALLKRQQWTSESVCTLLERKIIYFPCRKSAPDSSRPITQFTSCSTRIKAYLNCYLTQLSGYLVLWLAPRKWIRCAALSIRFVGWERLFLRLIDETLAVEALLCKHCLLCWHLQPITKKSLIKAHLFHGPTALVGLGFLVLEISKSQSDTPHPLGLLWMRNPPTADTSTWQNTTLTRNRLPCPRRVSKPQSQQASGRRSTP
jgi:hypothetical protein